MADNWTPKTGKVIDSWTPKTGSIVSNKPIAETKPKLRPILGNTPKELAEKGHWVLGGLAKTGEEIFQVPAAHFLNQFLYNLPRAGYRKAGYEYPEAESPGGKILSRAAGVTGGLVSPITRILGAVGLAPKAAGLGERVVRGIASGATGGTLYTPTEDIVGLEQRRKQATGGAVLGGLFGLGSGVVSKIKAPKPLLTKEDQFLLQKSDDIYNVTQKAKGSIQEEYAGFRDATKDTPIDLVEVNASVKKLYGKTAKDVGQILPEEFTKEMKSIVSESEGSNLGVIYKVKDTISKHIKPATWRKFKMGEQLTPDQEKLIGSYFDFDKLIDTSLEKAGLVEEKQMLDYLNQKATDLYGVTGQVKKMVVDTLGKPQKTSEIKSIFLGGGNAGKKALFQQLSEFEPSILEITQGLEKYKNMQLMKTMLKRAGLVGLGYLGFEKLKSGVREVSP